MQVLWSSIRIVVACLVLTPALYGADMHNKLVMELDPMAPASALIDETDDKPTSKWGGNVDFNLAGELATGPEFWTGTFTRKGPDDPTMSVRREDLQFGEKHKIDAVRLRWTVSRFEKPASLRGWYIKGGYSYTRVNSRANRYSDEESQTPALRVLAPEAKTDLVSDIRHGVVAGVGNRWMFFDNSASFTLGASYTANFKRTVSVESNDSFARADYDAMIEEIPDTRMATRPVPEINMSLGFVW